MKLTHLITVTSVALLFLSTHSIAQATCDVDLAEVNAALAAGAGTDLSVEVYQAAVAARDEGASLCEAGNDAAATEKLAEAKFMLGVYAE